MKQLFTIPLGDQSYLFYAPLKGFKAIINDQTLKQLQQQKIPEEFPEDLFQPEPEPVDPFNHTIRYDTLILFLTNQCNLRCIYCYARSGEYTAQKLKREQIVVAMDHFFDEVSRNGVKRVTLGFHGGGEPTVAFELLKQSVIDFQKRAEEMGLNCSIAGAFNGFWSESVTDFMVEHFTDCSISIDGIPDIHDQQRPAAGGAGSLETIAETLIALDQSDINYGIRITVTEDALPRLVEGIEWICERFQPGKIQIEPVFESGRADHGGFSIREPLKFVEAYVAGDQICDQYGIELFYSGARPDILTTRFCTAPANGLIVTTEGLITGCFEIYGADHPLGEHYLVGAIKDQKVIIDQQKRQHHINRTVDTLAGCANCFCKWHCAGDCLVKQQGIRDRCLITREITLYLLLKEIQSG